MSVFTRLCAKLLISLLLLFWASQIIFSYRNVEQMTEKTYDNFRIMLLIKRVIMLPEVEQIHQYTQYLLEALAFYQLFVIVMIFFVTNIGGYMFFILQASKLLFFYIPHFLNAPRMAFTYNHRFELFRNIAILAITLLLTGSEEKGSIIKIEVLIKQETQEGKQANGLDEHQS